MRCAWPALVVALSNVVAAGCSRDGGGEEACREAADLCGAAGDFDDEDCAGDQRAYAECIVERGDCEPQTLVDCAQGGGGGGDGGPTGGSIELSVTSFTDSGVGLVQVAFEITNVSESEPIPVAPPLFQLEDEAANLHLSSGGICVGGELLARGGSEECDLQFTIGAAAPRALIYRDGQGRTAESALAGVCAGLEITEPACTDGCDNDDDGYTDCDDYDCCDLVDCPSSSQCGEREECAAGAEDTSGTCSDGCSNDGDSYVDCDDYDCCDAVSCPSGTACGDR